jgi:MFS family permease
MICLLSLAINLKVFGWIGDRIGYKLFLLIGMVTLTLTFLSLSLFLSFDIKNSVIYIIMFALIGLFSCTGWPSCLSVTF